MLSDKTLQCRDCRGTFVFTAGEQGHFLELGLVHDPRRCPGCRGHRRRGNRGRAMTSVTCATCGAEAAVPFVPHLGRPVYCDPCYERTRAGSHPLAPVS